MVKIRYSELPAGLHVSTEVRGRYTIVYLLPGLTPAERRAAITFARRSARIGHGPRVPVLAMALALTADWVRAVSRVILAVLRKHPVLLLPLVALVSAVIVITTLSLVKVTIATRADAQAAGQMPANGGQLPAGQSGTQADRTSPGLSTPAHQGGSSPATGGPGTGGSAPRASRAVRHRHAIWQVPQPWPAPAPSTQAVEQDAPSLGQPDPSSDGSPVSSGNRMCLQIGPVDFCPPG